MSRAERARDAARRLKELRARIAQLDEQLVHLIGERRRLAIEIGAAKSALGLPVLDPQREAEVVRHAAAIARNLGVDEEMTRDVLWRIIASARQAQVESGLARNAGAEPAGPGAAESQEEKQA